MKPVRLLCYMFFSLFGPDSDFYDQLSIPIILNLLTNRNIALIYSVTICEQKDCARQGASNINYSTVVFNCDVCRLS